MAGLKLTDFLKGVAKKEEELTRKSSEIKKLNAVDLTLNSVPDSMKPVFKDIIEDTIVENVNLNLTKVSSILDDIFDDKGLSMDKRVTWVNKIAKTLGIQDYESYEYEDLYLEVNRRIEADDTVSELMMNIIR